MNLMKNRIAALLIMCAFVVTLGRADDAIDKPQPLTLKDCYQLALKQSEQLAIKQTQIKEAEGRFLQSLSGALPKLSWEYTHTYKEIGTRDDQSAFTFSQPLFSGFKEFAAMAGAKAQGRQHRNELAHAKNLLLIDVADAFYYYGLYQADLQSTQAIAKTLDERMVELKRRADLGRSRPSELASAEARLRRAEAQVEQIRSQMITARELLEFLTGTSLETIDDSFDRSFIPQTEESLNAYALNRPDVKAAMEAVTVAQKQVAAARAGFFPNVSLDGNYYTKKETPASSDWDVALKVDVPLFQGGENIGKLKEAKAQAQSVQLAFSETQRKALLDIRQAYARLEAASIRSAALKKALAAAEKNYELQAKDYGLNMVSNLDVLQALTDLEDVRRDYISADNEGKRYYWQFKVKTGEVSDVDF